MKISIIDPNVNKTVNGFLILANFLNLVYNIPQMIQTYQTRSTKDINKWFIILRVLSNGIWMIYGIYINSFLMMFNNLDTVSASMFIGYYKYREGRSAVTPTMD